MRLLVTGGAGFIGSNFIRVALQPDSAYQALNMDALTYAGNLETLEWAELQPRYGFIRGDIANRRDVDQAFERCRQLFGGPVDAIVHFAAESHVDRSIEDPALFVRTNVLGTQTLLHAARTAGVKRFIHVSTDEVYGSLGSEGRFTEETTLAPNSPYSASKAGSDLLVRAYFETYGFPAVTTRCSNNYGPYQFPEKLLPLMISNALEDKPLPVYGDGRNVRDWIHVEDHCQAILQVLEQGTPGRVYNVGGNAERENLEVVRGILQILNKSEDLIQFVPDRPGHDRRYAIDSSRIQREIGWKPRWRFEEGLEATVRWYQENQPWVQRVRSGAYRDYYKRMYANRPQWVDSFASSGADDSDPE